MVTAAEVVEFKLQCLSIKSAYKNGCCSLLELLSAFSPIRRDSGWLAKALGKACSERWTLWRRSQAYLRRRD